MSSRLSQFDGRTSRRLLLAVGCVCLFAWPIGGAENDPPTIQPVVENQVEPGPSNESSPTFHEHRPRHAAAWVAHQAASRVPLGNLMRADLQADRSSVVKPTDKQKAVLQLRDRVQEFRIARQTQIASAKAMEIHFGLATIEALQNIQSQSRASLDLQRQRQDRAVELGIGILDPGAVGRLSTTLDDQRIELESKAAQLRSRLALLVGTSIACGYSAEPMEIPPCPPPMLNSCDYITEAYTHRCDLVGLVFLRRHLTVETLEVARWMSDILTASAPATFFTNGIPGLSLINVLFARHRNDDEAELRSRLALLDQAIATLREKIASEVDIAVEKQRAAAERYCNAVQRVEQWQTRIDQLQRYGDQVKPLLDDEAEALSNRFQAQADAVQRQGDWHQAIVELSLAVGALP